MSHLFIDFLSEDLSFIKLPTIFAYLSEKKNIYAALRTLISKFHIIYLNTFL